MKQICHIDIETFSECKLKESGVYKYAENPTTKILCLAWALNNEEPKIWVPRDEPFETGIKNIFFSAMAPSELREALEESDVVAAWNAMFERVILNNTGTQYFDGLLEIRTNRWECSMIRAASAGLPQSLEKAAIAWGSKLKDKGGHGEMLQLSKPRKPSKENPDTEWSIDKYQDKYIRLYNYCIDDVLAERELYDQLPSISDTDKKMYVIDQYINDRGIRVDQEFVAKAIELRDDYKRVLEDRSEAISGLKPRSRQAIKEWCEEQGCDIPNLQAATVKDWIDKRQVTDKDVIKLLRIYASYNKRAPSKYTTMQNAVTDEGLLRGMFRYYGASTGRWSSQIVQLQNLKRPDSDIDVNSLIDNIKACNDSLMIEFLYGKGVMDLLGSCVRGALCAGPKELFVCRDYSQIEARVLAWIAGHQRLLKLFKDGKDIYQHTASSIYNKHPSAITDDERFIGKTATLALGYQGGAGAFETMAKNFGVEVQPSKAEYIKAAWRTTNKPIVKLWYELEDAAVDAIRNKGSVEKVNEYISFKCWKQWLVMRLPSGRCLYYYKPILVDGMFGKQQVVYSGVDTFNRQWGDVYTYGGKLTENAVQAVSRDVMVESMLGMSSGGVKLIGSVHDEVLAVATEDRAEETMHTMARHMSLPPKWAPGLPVDSDGFISKRYGK